MGVKGGLRLEGALRLLAIFQGSSQVIQRALDGSQLIIQEIVELAQRVSMFDEAIKRVTELFPSALAGDHDSQPTQPHNRYGYEPILHITPTDIGLLPRC
jgi:hypothetical protein